VSDPDPEDISAALRSWDPTKKAGSGRSKGARASARTERPEATGDLFAELEPEVDVPTRAPRRRGPKFDAEKSAKDAQRRQDLSYITYYFASLVCRYDKDGKMRFVDDEIRNDPNWKKGDFTVFDRRLKKPEDTWPGRS